MISYLNTPIPLNRSFYLSSGGTLEQLLDWDAWTIKIDNFTPQWLHVRGSDEFVAPNTYGAFVSANTSSYAETEFAAPPGIIQPAAQAGTFAKLTFFDTWMPPSPGFPSKIANAALTSSTVIPIVRPNLDPSGIAVTAGAMPSYGAWFQIAPANDLSNHALYSISLYPSDTGTYQIQIGTGPAGFEVGIGEWYKRGTNPTTPLVIPVTPMEVIPPNARLAVRAAGNVQVIYVTVGLVPLPL